MADKTEKISDATKDAEARDAEAQHGAPQVPTADEAAAADRNGGASPEAAEAYEDYLDKAKDAKGEGRIP
jgi:hypothetical protein